jgi:hypothetical protein
LAYVEHTKAIELVAIEGMNAYCKNQIGPPCKYLTGYNLPSPMQLELLASVFQHWVQISSQQRISMSGLPNLYAEDTVGKVWTILVGNEPVDIH